MRFTFATYWSVLAGTFGFTYGNNGILANGQAGFIYPNSTP